MPRPPRRAFPGLLGCAVAACLVAVSVPAARAQDGPPFGAAAPEGFGTSLDEGLARARAENRLLFVDFTHPL